MTDDLSFKSAFDKSPSIFTVLTKSGSVEPGRGGLLLMMIPPGPLGINWGKGMQMKAAIYQVFFGELSYPA